MKGEQWTFLVLRGEDGPVRQYSVPARVVRLGSWIGGFCLLVILAFTLGIGLDGTGRMRAAILEARNQALETELAEFQQRIEEIEGKLDDVAESDAQFRSIAGLEFIEPEVLQAGVGGPGLGTPESSPLWASDSTLAQSLFAVSYDLSALERRARLLSESLEAATDSVVAHEDLLESTPSILPTSGWLSSSYSRSRVHPIHNRPIPHPGVDIAAPTGTPIYASAKGRITRASWVAGYGLTVEIDHGYGYTTLYGHASKLIAQRGQEVSRGEMIAQVGSTGLATASHLHYEVRVDGDAEDPARYILPAVLRY
ncbi:MAG: M23 family metallopeptidase [Gemmatimonadota bacterium]|nr:M23 family metallopeptidase [Gemmatimonadota bacterium]